MQLKRKSVLGLKGMFEEDLVAITDQRKGRSPRVRSQMDLSLGRGIKAKAKEPLSSSEVDTSFGKNFFANFNGSMQSERYNID